MKLSKKDIVEHLRKKKKRKKKYDYSGRSSQRGSSGGVTLGGYAGEVEGQTSGS